MSDEHQKYPRKFYLFRGVDQTGISGTGIVADGVEWQDGSVTLKWLGDHSSEVSWKGMADVEHIHGHNGLTSIVWRDDEDGHPFHDQTRCPYRQVKSVVGPVEPKDFGSLQRGIADVEAGRVKPLPHVTE